MVSVSLMKLIEQQKQQMVYYSKILLSKSKYNYSIIVQATYRYGIHINKRWSLIIMSFCLGIRVLQSNTVLFDQTSDPPYIIIALCLDE